MTLLVTGVEEAATMLCPSVFPSICLSLLAVEERVAKLFGVVSDRSPLALSIVPCPCICRATAIDHIGLIEILQWLTQYPFVSRGLIRMV